MMRHGELTEKQKQEIDELARSFPTWQNHLRNFRKKHPELSPQETMKKAGFTFRMKKGRLIKGWMKSMAEQILRSIEKNEKKG